MHALLWRTFISRQFSLEEVQSTTTGWNSFGTAEFFFSVPPQESHFALAPSTRSFSRVFIRKIWFLNYKGLWRPEFRSRKKRKGIAFIQGKPGGLGGLGALGTFESWQSAATLTTTVFPKKSCLKSIITEPFCAALLPHD